MQVPKPKNYCRCGCEAEIPATKKWISGHNLKKKNSKVKRKCENCYQTFYVYQSEIKKGGGVYCSKKCYVERQKNTGYVPKNFISSVDNRGKNNGRYKHGKRIGGHTQKRKLREKVIQRDGGNWCLFCGKPGPGLHLHRIRYGSQGGRYELNNCVQLCPIHHDLVHSSKRKWMPILKNYIETKVLELPKDWK